MKKFITVAALLAAGSAFANAATLTYVDFASTVTTSDTKSVSAKAGTFTFDTKTSQLVVTKPETKAVSIVANNGWTVTDTGLKASSTNGNRIEIEASSEDFGFAGNTGTISLTLINNGNTIDYSTSTSSAVVTQLFNVSTNGANTHDALILTESGLITYVNGWKWTTSLVNRNDASTTWESGTSRTFTVTLDAGNTVKTYIDGILVNTGTQSELNWDEATKFYIGNSVALKNFTVSDFATSDLCLSESEVGALANKNISYVVPEPSAFGLLAGIGALALVASRRRRK